MASPSRWRSNARAELRARRPPVRLLLALAVAASFAVTARDADPDSTDAYVYRGGVTLPSLGTSALDRSPAGAQDLYLDVFHDDRPIGLIAHFRLRGGRLASTVEELAAIGLALPAHVFPGGDGLIDLDTLSGLSYRYEPATQRLILHIPASLRPSQTLGYQPPGAVEVQRDSGAVLDYDLYGRGIGEDYSLTLGHALRWFGRAGALELSGTSRAGDGADAYRRLETYWTYSDPERLWTWTAGDLISGGLPWSRPVRMGGVQWRRNFGVRPDLVTLPLPRFAADAAVPSSVELFVNNVRQFGGQVQDGPFVLDTLPRISGAGEASLVVTDALGRVTRTTLPLYVDYQRLAPGLSDFSVEAGWLRHGYGSEDDGYGDEPVASASWRRGMTDTVTLEAHGEAGAGTRVAGLGLVWSPGNRWGLATASYARSGGDSSGEQHTIGYQWNSLRFGFDLHRLRRSDGFRDLGDVGLDAASILPALRGQDRATFWLPIAGGSLAITWLRWRDGDDVSHRTRSFSWTQVLASRLSLSLSVFDDQDSGRGGGVIASIPLGDRLQASAGVQRNRERTTTLAALRRDAPYEGGWGWNVQADDRPGGYVQAAAQVRGRYGEAWFGVERADGDVGGFVQGGGSVVLMDGQWFFSRRIYDAFAVVSTQGVADVLIRSENRAYGRTDGDGYLLVPELRGWQRNRLAIDPDDLGPDYRIGALEQFATPADRSGVRVEFAMRQVDPAVVVLLDPVGRPVPAGSRGRLVDSGLELLVGFDGEAYVDDLSADRAIELDVGGVRCRYALPPAQPSGQASMQRETLYCEAQPP